jgi:hypothetical protein
MYHRLVSIGVQLLAMMLTNLLPDILLMAISVSDMVNRALCPISGSNDSRKRHEMCLISKLGTVHPSGINELFSYV